LSVIDKSIEFAVQLIEEFVSGGYKSMLDFYSKSKKNFSADANGSDASIQLKNSKNELN